ncbi:MAG TPA: hypothetical protein VHE34_14315 [Puia sp.]|nr:hypothetical protein [Puia sp.]
MQESTGLHVEPGGMDSAADYGKAASFVLIVFVYVLFRMHTKAQLAEKAARKGFSRL